MQSLRQYQAGECSLEKLCAILNSSVKDPCLRRVRRSLAVPSSCMLITATPVFLCTFAPYFMLRFAQELAQVVPRSHRLAFE
jgi:hypothetical protein